MNEELAVKMKVVKELFPKLTKDDLDILFLLFQNTYLKGAIDSLSKHNITLIQAYDELSKAHIN